MAIETRCTGCHAILSIDVQHVGKRGRCPSCGTEYPIPESTDQASLNAICHFCGEVLTFAEQQRDQGEYKTCDKCRHSIDQNIDALENERQRFERTRQLFVRFCMCTIGLFALYLILQVLYD